MFALRGGFAAALVSATCCGCGSLAPSLPPDPTYSVQEILYRTTCELQRAFVDLDRERDALNEKKYTRFKPGGWLIGVSLIPKVNTELAAGFGTTRKVPATPSVERLTTWVIGAAPGIAANVKAERTGGVTFNIKSAKLLKSKLSCNADTPTQVQLAENLGVGSWLRRTADALNATPDVDMDKPTYNTDITIKFGGSGSYTYSFAQGSDLASLSGSYSIDEQLNISMTTLPASVRAPTLPAGDRFDGKVNASKEVTSTFDLQAAKGRLDSMQLEQAIRSLRLPAQ